jgi:hypothetical protein
VYTDKSDRLLPSSCVSSWLWANLKQTYGRLGLFVQRVTPQRENHVAGTR